MKTYTLLSIFYIVILLITSSKLYSQTNVPLAVEVGMNLYHFQQQIKQEVGDERGQRLVEETVIGFALQLRYPLLPWLEAGIFVNYDFGTRRSARFVGFDSTGKTITSSNLGGDFNEIWFGPLLRCSWKQLFLETGYAVVGSRSDDGRTDILSTSGDSTSSLSLKPGIAWLLGIGGKLSITDDISAVIKIEYRFRYYSKRNGEEFIDGIEHGTQSVAPYIGIMYQL